MVRRLRVRRKGYRAKRRVNGVVRYKVKPTTFYIRDRGKPGRGPKVIPPLKEGALGRYGYRMSASSQSRRRALAKAVRANGYRKVLGRLIALQVLFKRTEPRYSRIAVRDRKWLVKKFGGSW